ncbi:ATP-binding cassette domain-containing protein [Actinoplanes sp. NPDC049596]|uniref:ATP-binding cassette domain-containing protein n=1 Tax=unclassified Actinoplanes TaxID=2626549 RepID=UPI003427A436
MTDIAVAVEGLGKMYGDRPAVLDLDLTVPGGEVFGFLGPNGAGKTTTIGMLCTLVRPTAGRAVVSGYDVVTHPAEVRRRIGLVFQESSLDGDLTAAENLRFQAALFGTARRRIGATVGAMLDLVGLAERADSPVRTFSGGMRRRLEIARGLLHTPRVLFLDEPTTGLDPQTRTAIWAHLHELRRRQGVTVFLTTHHLEEAANCDSIAIVDRGELVARGTPDELRAVVGSDLLQLRTADDAAAAAALRARFGLTAETGPDGLRVRVTDGSSLLPRLCAELAVPISAATITPPTLDDVFLHYTGRTMRDGPSPAPATALRVGR